MFCPLFVVAQVDRQQRQPQVAHAAQQAVQRGLVGDGAAQHGVAICRRRDRHAVKPLRPRGAEVAGDPNYVVRSASLAPGASLHANSIPALLGGCIDTLVCETCGYPLPIQEEGNRG